MTKLKVVDQSIRDELLDITQSFIVQAPAGSGKTELLTQRILALLATVQKPESILAITFTRKAAAEMRERVISALALAQEEQPESAHELKRWKLAKNVLKVDQEKGWNLVANPSRLNLYTIDALSASLSGALPLVSQTGTIPAIEEKSYQYYLQAAENMFGAIKNDDAAAKNMKTLLIYKDNNLKQVVDLIAQLLAKRMQWLARVNDKEHELTCQQLFESINTIVAEKLKSVYQAFPSDILSEIPALLNQTSNILSKTNKKNIDNLRMLNNDYPDGVSAIESPIECDLILWKAISEMLLTASKTKPSFYKSANKGSGFPLPADAENETQAADFTTNKALMIGLLKDLSKETGNELLDLLNDVRLLPDDIENIIDSPVLQAVIELLPVAAGYLKLVFQQKNILDFNELSLSALFALGSTDNPTDVALALDYQIEHILLDEFQDTSSPQIKLLELLTAGWDSSSSKSLFLVGDPMQSIYRFRDANVSLFMQIVKFGIGQLKPKFKQLEVNFRSNNNIIEWVNKQFSQIMPLADDFTLSAVSYAPSIAFHPSLDSSKVVCKVTVDANHHKTQAEETLKIVKNHLLENNAIKQKQSEAKSSPSYKQAPLKSLAILARSRSHLKDIIELLNRENISYQAVDIEPLAQKMVVSDIVNLALALTDNYDQLSWASCLRSPWYALRLNDIRIILSELHNSKDSFPNVLDRLAKMSNPGALLNPESVERIKRVQPILNHAIKQKGKKPFVKWLTGCFDAVGGLLQVDIASEHQDLKTAIETIAAFESGGEIIDRQGLQQALDGLYAAPNPHADHQVQIMTIHKSKGLEFDRVILPRLDGDSGKPDAPLLKWTEVIDKQGHAHNLLAISKQAGKENDSVYQYISYLDKQKEKYENQRVLYVAVTRAKSELYLLANVNTDKKKVNEDGSPLFKAPVANSFLNLLWPELQNDLSIIESYNPESDNSSGQKNMVNISEDELALTVKRSDSMSDAQHLSAQLQAIFPTRQVKKTSIENIVQLNSFDADQACSSEDKDETQNKSEDFLKENIYLQVAKLTASRIGTVLHRQLEWLSHQTLDQNYLLPNDWKEITKGQLVNEGVSPNDQKITDYSAAIIRGLENTLNDDMGRFILTKHEQAKSELVLHKNVLNGLYLTRIVDRTFVSEGKRWIVDYKSSEPAENESLDEFLLKETNEYKKQMDDYVRLFKLKENRPIIAGLYFPMLSYFHKMFED